MSLSKKIHLKDDERIIFTARPFIITYIWRYFFGLAFLFVSSFFMFRLFFYGWQGYVVYGLGMFLGVYTILRAWFVNNLNVLAVTGSRAVDVHRLGWFDEIISSVNFLDIKDLAVRKKGVAQNLFDFGDLIIQTNSRQFILEILNIRHPAKIQLLLAEAGQQYRQDVKVANTRVIYNNFIKIIPDLVDGDLKEARRLIDEQLGSNDVV